MSNPGIVFEVEIKDHEHSPPRLGSMEILVEGPNLAIPITASGGSGGNGKMIFRGDKGFPVVVIGFGEDGDIEDESWLKRTRRQRIDPAAFEPPSGYKRRTPQ